MSKELGLNLANEGGVFLHYSLLPGAGANADGYFSTFLEAGAEAL